MATFHPRDGGRPAALKDVPVTVMGLAPHINTTWTSSTSKVALKTTAPNGLQTDSGGTATNVMHCKDRNVPVKAIITVTPQGGEPVSATYNFDIYYLTGIFSSGWAQSGEVDPNKASDVVIVETEVKARSNDVVHGPGIRVYADSDNLQFFNPFSATPNTALQKNDGHYEVIGDKLGHIKLKVGATAPGIYEFILGPTDEGSEIPVRLVFIDVQAEDFLEPTGIGKNGQLDLDNYAGNTVPVNIASDVQAQFNEKTPVVLVRVPKDGNNPALQPIGPIHTVGELSQEVEYSKTLFPDGSYYIYHMVFDALSGSFAQSKPYLVTVTGKSDVQPNPNGTLQAPNVQVYRNSIVTQNIVPYILVGIPQYDGMAVGDIVTLDIFIDAWDTSGNKRVAHLPYPQPQISGTQQFAIQIPPEDLTNYCSDPSTGQSGTIQFQYTVQRGALSIASRIAKLPIDTGPIVP